MVKTADILSDVILTIPTAERKRNDFKIYIIAHNIDQRNNYLHNGKVYMIRNPIIVHMHIK